MILKTEYKKIYKELLEFFAETNGDNLKRDYLMLTILISIDQRLKQLVEKP